MGRAPNWQAAEEKPIVVLGAGGMLATALVHELEEREQHYEALSERDLDITNDGRVATLLKSLCPRVVVNAAAFTDVDSAESHRELALNVNAQGAGNVAAAAHSVGATVVHFSTDYVFDGQKNGPYLPDDITNPINAYGFSKLEGERLVKEATGDHLIVRTSWLFGPGGKNFVSTMLKLGAERETLKMIHDQTGSPTYTRHLADGTLTMMEKGARGIYHLANFGTCTWYQFAREIFKRSGIAVDVLPCTTEAYPTPARRPLNSVLDCTRSYEVLSTPMPSWQAAVAQYLEEFPK